MPPTATREAVRLPGGHVLEQVTGTRWVRLPLREAPPSQVLTLEEMKALEALTEFPFDGAHFFCETLDATRPVHVALGARAACSLGACPEMVWNHWLRSPLEGLGLGSLCPALVQGLSEVKELQDAKGEPYSLALIARRSRIHAGTRYLARGINAGAGCGNERARDRAHGQPALQCRQPEPRSCAYRSLFRRKSDRFQPRRRPGLPPACQGGH